MRISQQTQQENGASTRKPRQYQPSDDEKNIFPFRGTQEVLGKRQEKHRYSKESPARNNEGHSHHIDRNKIGTIANNMGTTWQEMNDNNNTNNKSALTKWFETNKGVGLHKATMTICKQTIKKMPDEPPEGSWQTKVPLDRVLSESIHSCPMVKDKCLAAS